MSLMQSWTASDSLRKHMLAVEAAVRAYAARLGEDADRWGAAALLHDFDYERFPNAAQLAHAEHPAEGVRYLREHGYPDDVCDAILGHAHYTGVARESLMAKALFACDELTGLITASALVKPSRSLADVDVAGVRKKMKDKAFARGVNRDDIIEGAQALGISLDDHIAVVLEAMRGIADTLGLDGRDVARASGTSAATSTAERPLSASGDSTTQTGGA